MKLDNVPAAAEAEVVAAVEPTGEEDEEPMNESQTENATLEQTDETDGVCSAALATRIHKTIVVNILPQLYKCLTYEVG